MRMSYFGCLSYLFILHLILNLSSCSDNLLTEIEEEPQEISVPDPYEVNGGCIRAETPIYHEENGILNIEVESSSYKTTFWRVRDEIPGFSGEGYLKWEGADYFNEPGNGLLSFKIRVTKAGTYRFVWRSYITEGHDATEFNDSWLRIADADHFYGQKPDGHIVYPRGSLQDPIPESEGQGNTSPVGSSSEGWFKIYMNTVDAWDWLSSTSDHDAHAIYAVFKEPGDYTVEISGRSKGHGIDKFVLFHSHSSANDAFNLGEPSEVSCE